jgi:hypothetical protein
MNSTGACASVRGVAQRRDGLFPLAMIVSSFSLSVMTAIVAMRADQPEGEHKPNLLSRKMQQGCPTCSPGKSALCAAGRDGQVQGRRRSRHYDNDKRKGGYALTASVYANVYVKVSPLFGAGLSEELTMTKSILAITILALTTSGALAAHHRHHHQAMNASPVVGALPPIGAPSPVIWPGAVSSSDHADYVKNLRESGYNPKNDYNTNGTIKNQ